MRQLAEIDQLRGELALLTPFYAEAGAGGRGGRP